MGVASTEFNTIRAKVIRESPGVTGRSSLWTVAVSLEATVDCVLWVGHFTFPGFSEELGGLLVAWRSIIL